MLNMPAAAALNPRADLEVEIPSHKWDADTYFVFVMCTLATVAVMVVILSSVSAYFTFRQVTEAIDAGSENGAPITISLRMDAKECLSMSSELSPVVQGELCELFGYARIQSGVENAKMLMITALGGPTSHSPSAFAYVPADRAVAVRIQLGQK